MNHSEINPSNPPHHIIDPYKALNEVGAVLYQSIPQLSLVLSILDQLTEELRQGSDLSQSLWGMFYVLRNVRELLEEASLKI